MSDQQTTRTWARIHLNSAVRVKLNRVGLAEYERQQIDIRARVPERARRFFALEPRLDDEGYYQTEMWHLMERFGHLMTAGAQMPWDGDMLVEESADV